jgi:hypothetical protein
MTEQQLSRIRLYFTGLVMLIIWSMLIWQYSNAGVPSHHLLHRADLPAISNWWGGLLLPALSWIMLGRIQKRILKQPSNSVNQYSIRVSAGFICALIYGGILSFSFINGYAQVSSVMFYGILFFAIFLKVYREEYLLGFILSMSFTIGAVLPTVFGAIIATVSAIIYFVVHYIWSGIKKRASHKQAN